MAIKAGQILHDAQGFVIDRIQTGGVSGLNIPQEKVYELGNFNSVATVRDVPDLTFDIESFDVYPELESLVVGKNPSTIPDGTQIDFADYTPLDVISPFRSALNSYDIVKGISIPYLTIESVSYRFGVGQNASQQFSFKGDSVYYIPGSPYYEEFTITSGTNQSYNFAHTAIPYSESGSTLYALSVCAKNTSTGAYKRLFIGSDYTNTSTAVTTLANLYAQGYTKLHVTYGSTTAATYNSTVNESISVKPAAVRAKDICVYVSDGAATPTLELWRGVQNFEVTRRVTLENEQEFCNTKYVTTDYDVPDVSGTIGVRSVDPADLWAKIAQVANVSTNVVAGLYSSAPLEVLVKVKNPDTGDTIKTIQIPDARFTAPSVQGRVQQKLETTFSFTSDSGLMYVYKGDM